MPENLENNKWVEYQFDHRKDRREFRDVILHASFIESTIVAESLKLRPLGKDEKYRSFGNAIKDSNSSPKDNTGLQDIKKLKEKRNALVHGVIADKLNQNQIGQLINDFYILVVKIYNSDIFNKIWDKEYYGFLPKDKFMDFQEASDQQVLDKSSDS